MFSVPPLSLLFPRLNISGRPIIHQNIALEEDLLEHIGVILFKKNPWIANWPTLKQKLTRLWKVGTFFLCLVHIVITIQSRFRILNINQQNNIFLKTQTLNFMIPYWSVLSSRRWPGPTKEPKIWSAASLMVMGRPKAGSSPPTKKPIS